jgi:hypothetical protein
MDLENGLLEALQIKIDEWSFCQVLNYNQIPFKCHIFHENGHFHQKLFKISIEIVSFKENPKA